MTCKVCRKEIAIMERFSVCHYKAKDGHETRWFRCEACQRKAMAILEGSVLKPSGRSNSKAIISADEVIPQSQPRKVQPMKKAEPKEVVIAPQKNVNW